MLIVALLILILLVLLFGAQAVKSGFQQGCGLIALVVLLTFIMIVIGQITTEQWAWIGGVAGTIVAVALAGWSFLRRDEKQRAGRVERAEHVMRVLKEIGDTEDLATASLVNILVNLGGWVSDDQQDRGFDLAKSRDVSALEAHVRTLCEGCDFTLTNSYGHFEAKTPSGEPVRHSLLK